MGKTDVQLGPRPAEAAVAAPAARVTVLSALVDAGRPLALATVSDRTGLHPNTVREHLDALLDAGRVERHRAAPSGRGRPAWLYVATPAAEELSPYAALASSLAAALSRSSAAPGEEAAAAGWDWGRELVRGRSSTEPHRRVAEVLDELGFAPRATADGGVLQLTRCPLLDAARAFPDVVCAVHLGLVRGALEQLGAAPVAELFPFSEPGACRLELTPAQSTTATVDR